MNLAEYFKTTDGIGVLATSDKSGSVDIAMYAKPHVVDVLSRLSLLDFFQS